MTADQKSRGLFFFQELHDPFDCRRHHGLHGVRRQNPERLRLPVRHHDRPLPQAQVAPAPVQVPRGRQDQGQLLGTAGVGSEAGIPLPHSPLQLNFNTITNIFKLLLLLNYYFFSSLIAI